jgi:glyoxylase-like metal-dependent hydrolase (beta-lactamase superfamily II)
MLRYQILPVTPFQQNCSIVWCDETREAAVIDPGGDLPRIKAEAARLGVTLKQILLTHAHIDHAGGTGTLARDLGLPVIGPHPGDQFWIDGLAEQAKMFGFAPAEPFVPTRWLADGDTVTVGHCVLTVRHCPGHTPGHVVFANTQFGVALVGDVLFKGSIGRTDFPRGDHATLIRSITTQLWPLGDEMQFVPGHGPMSTFGAERRSNPFVGDAALRRAP